MHIPARKSDEWNFGSIVNILNNGVYLGKIRIQLSKEEKPTIDLIAEALDTVQAQLGALRHQRETICEYLEKGIYTIDMFTKRNAALSREIRKLKQISCERKHPALKQIKL